MNYVADTHALIWWFTESPRISDNAAEIFSECERGETVLFIPSIVIAEALSIFDKKRVAFDFKRLLRRMHTSDNFVIIPLDYSILQEMVPLRDIPELHDKIIVATAKYLKLPLITKDKVLKNTPGVKTLW